MNVIEQKDRRQITKDWECSFPSLKKYKSLFLLRRNGPFVCGIYHKVGSSRWAYQPIFHIHNLMVDFPVIASGAPTHLLTDRGTPDFITARQHKEGFAGYIDRMRKQIQLLQNDTISLNEMVCFLKTSVEHYNGYPVNELRDIVLALYWCGKDTEAKDEIERAKKIISCWPQGGFISSFYTVNGFEQQVKSLMNISILHDTVEKQIEKYKLGSFSDYGFLY